MPSNIALKGMNIVHRTLLKVSGGRKGWTAGGMPALELSTTGRKSGEKRAVMLTSPHQEGDSMLIVASRGGDDIHPAWYLNLQANPAVEVTTKAGTKSMLARVLSSDERSEIWPVVVAKYKNYGGYQEKTDREIPLVFLDPA
ncbi:MAG: deazaflavin-dependent oxidoreductase (nitroreductase family) [Candidatus Aldehydirespiratoraceae bacterium]|jgi:deazaflavin-dependent oxidoreductase (nitroreductase family)